MTDIFGPLIVIKIAFISLFLYFFVLPQNFEKTSFLSITNSAYLYQKTLDQLQWARSCFAWLFLGLIRNIIARSSLPFPESPLTHSE